MGGRVDESHYWRLQQFETSKSRLGSRAGPKVASAIHGEKLKEHILLVQDGIAKFLTPGARAASAMRFLRIVERAKQTSF
jgi:hypothetical protein